MGKTNNILLESGTNELEILVFTINQNYFGINVAKVKEIIKYCNITSIPNSHPCISGLIKPRDEIITVINLPKYLNTVIDENLKEDFFVITHFNKLTLAFKVHSVIGIQRLSWEHIESPDMNIYGDYESNVTGIVKNSEHLITILDFEKIVSDINPRAGIQASDINKLGERKNISRDKHILIAEDSHMLIKILEESLKKAGYNNLTITQNGKEAWELLKKAKENKNKKIRDIYSCVITDIEMPQMDGHHLTKSIKEDSVLQELPVIIFSSLISEAMYKKGQQLGADEQITKPEIGRLVEVLDNLIY